MQQQTAQHQDRVDVIANQCLRRLVAISKKGPCRKLPMLGEIETALNAAFNPSTFGESSDTTMRLKERNYPDEKIPIILPFLADGIIALGGMKAGGVFRIPSDFVSELKLCFYRGYYTLDSVDDLHVLASLLKLWLCELCNLLVPEEMYNDCIRHSREPEMCIQLVRCLPTINRRVVVFMINFLQFFLEEKVQTVTPANLALVMAPNLLRLSGVIRSLRPLCSQMLSTNKCSSIIL
ncbi:Rho GTPase activation protein [Suillus clintonianus]|uniref:Rho GTPase activation protein n=1 Tax=Suillus clintonianus TaxID=1904413 RepID=UPI001B85C89C|nr:Rho GTPase activation protein [Suillus clintonianus]KAG2112423.1 Rho GTPase activation protein [Suillus clintonianus]